MPDNKICKEHNPKECFYDCKMMHDAMPLTDEMMHNSISLHQAKGSFV